MLGRQGAFLFLSVLAVFAQDDLKHWYNDDIEIIRTATPEEGKPLVFAAKHRAEYNRTACYIYLLAEDGYGHNYYIADGIVSNGDGDVVDWMEVWDDGEENTCGITILDRNDYHGDVDHYDTGMIIHMTLSQGGLFGQPKLNRISAQIHVRDDLFTNIGKPYAPQNYDLTLVPDLLSDNPATHYSGNIKVTLEHESHPGTFPLVSVHMDGLNIRQLNGTLEREDGSLQNAEYEEIQFDLQKGKVMLTIDPSLLTEEDILTLDIDFEANIDPSDHTHAGLYKELCSDNSDKFCWFTQFESTSARYAFPCIDEPNKKATFDIKVARTEGWNTLSNMPIEDTVPVKGMDGWVWDIFQTTPVMSTYLIAFAIQDFVGVQGENDVTIWANKEDVEAGLADYSQDIGSKIIDFYGSTFGIPYSLPKMDMVSVPKKGGAMENWGLILFDGRALLIDNDSTDDDFRFQVLNIIAHEEAHQWFGNLVTCQWWSQTWLNEGFAVYVSYIGSSHVDPSMHSWDRMYVKETQRVMFYDQNTKQHWAMTDPVTDRGDVDRKFGMFTYQKGGSVIRMMEGILGEATLTKGMSNYLTAMSYQPATEDDLFLYLEEAALEDGVWPQADIGGPRGSLGETMKTWTNQAGFPVVQATKVCSATGDCAVTFSQEMLVIAGQEPVEGRRWDIQLTYGNVEGPFNINWLLSSSDEPLLVEDAGLQADSPLIVNRDGYGYYRVNYDEANWRAIAELLRTDHSAINPLNRAQIICDIMALEKTGHVSAEIRDDVLSYQPKEEQYGPNLAFEKCPAYGRGDYKATEEEMFRI